MKRFFGILNLLLCLELIIGPHFPGTRIFSIDVAKAETCPSGLIFDSTLNRCITSDQNAALINATASCNGDRECYKRLAEEELKKGEEEGKIAEAVKSKSGLFNKAIGIAAIAGPLLAAYTVLSVPNACGSKSMYAMAAGGVAQLAGHILTSGKHKKCLEKIKKDWEEKKAASDQKTSSGVSKVSVAGEQSEAFEMLAKSEECMEKTAKSKATFAAISAAAFAASAVLAGLELINPVTAATATCTISASTSNYQDKEFHLADYKIKKAEHTNLLKSQELAAFIVINENMNTESKSCSSIDRYEAVKAGLNTEVVFDTEVLEGFKTAANSIWSNLNLLGSTPAHAQVVEAVGGAAVAGGATAAVGTGAFTAAVAPVAAVGTAGAAGYTAAVAGQAATQGGIRGFLIRPETRLVLSGILAGWSAMMWMHANKQARVAKNRAEFLRKLKDQFNDANGAISCTSEERSTSANANCYCYTEGGQRNSARANSQVCQQLFAGTSPAQPGTLNPLGSSNERVCIAQNGSADASCSCARTRSCLNAIPGGLSNLGIGAVSAATNGLTPTNDIANGNIAPGSLNGAATLNTAARILAGKQELDKKLKLDPNKSSKMAKSIEGALIAGGAGTPSPLMAGSSLPLNMTPSQAAQALEKELGSERSFERVSGAPAVGQPGNSNPGSEVGFSLGAPEPIVPTEETQLAEVMKQDLNYGQADITKSDSNIFQILTNRYQRSGMRRLFDENEKAAPEAANKNDISQ